MLLLVIPVSAAGEEQEMTSLIEWIQTAPGVFEVPDPSMPDVMQKVILADEKVGDQPFRWRWNEHCMAVAFSETAGYSRWVSFSLGACKEHVTPSYQRVRWVLHDYNGDGVVDKWLRDYEIYTEQGIGVSPNYPDGFVDTEWWTPSREEAQRIFDQCANYWLSRAGRENQQEG